MAAKGDKGLSVTKSEDFSAWFTEVIQKAELADVRYHIKGFLVFQPWSVLSMETMYTYLEQALQAKGHEPYWYPTVIPEGNFTKESQHVKGFTPDVFWVTEGGEHKLEERLALRPTSETAFYQMFSLWLRSYKQLPFKTYQRAQVFRCETKATRPFLRSREFHWIETHCLFATSEGALAQVHEDMATTREVLHEVFGLPFLFFERPAWDRFPGAHRTFAADVITPDGKFLQLPSTHIINQHFLQAFNVGFKDAQGKETTPWSTCYGPAVSRIFGAVVLIHGDDKGLRFPWAIAPKHMALVPIGDAATTKAHALAAKLSSLGRVVVDTRDVSPGEKFNYWELKGIPVRIDIGEKELKAKKVSVYRRDTDQKELVAEKDLVTYIARVKEDCGAVLRKEADTLFAGMIKPAHTLKEIAALIEKGKVARCGFCSVDPAGAACAEKLETATGAQVRGTLLVHEKPSGNCVVCGDKAQHVVYVGKSY